MTCHKQRIPPLVLLGSVCAGAALAYLAAKQLCPEKGGGQKAELNDWESEGGSLTPASPAVPPASSPP
ncbi:hypothetical protein [Azospira oryzae]|jgi:hypothetical protein|uniref:hypothetical protein n=1 Tax=Azospira oryzae TaxID=146939 RepID=UPI00196527BF|nr:hypothetical protein [Azospira oryzae]